MKITEIWVWKLTKEERLCLKHEFTAIYEEGLAPTPVLSPGESHGQRSLAGCSPRGRTESDTTEAA